jgi:AcrR family transcriptional regulator
MTLPAETVPRPATKRYLAKKDRIVAAATRLLNETGVDGFTLARVAEVVGGHPATLGYYWRKDTLIEACLMDAADRIRAMAEAALEKTSPAGRIRAFLMRYFDERRSAWRGEVPELADFAELRQSGPAAFEAYKAMFKAIAWLFKGADVPGEAGRRGMGKAHDRADRLVASVGAAERRRRFRPRRRRPRRLPEPRLGRAWGGLAAALAARPGAGAGRSEGRP